jgi:hypothetical protein
MPLQSHQEAQQAGAGFLLGGEHYMRRTLGLYGPSEVISVISRERITRSAKSRR